MKRISVLLSLLSVLVVAGTGSAAAQTPESEGAGVVLAVDPVALVEALAANPEIAVLPEGLANISSATPAAGQEGDPLAVSLASLLPTVGTVTMGFQTNPAIVPGLVSTASLTYIVTDSEISGDVLAEFEERLRQDLSATDDPTIEASVAMIQVAGTDAVGIKVITTTGGIVALAQLVAVPVGNTLVVSLILSASQDEVDEATVLELTSNLALAGIEHLGAVAAGAI